MKHYVKECKTLKQVDAYLKKIGLECFAEFESYFAPVWYDFDYDGWQTFDENDAPLTGVSVQVEKWPDGDFVVSCSKYTAKDIDKLEKELWA
jgi:hypothetical protein